MIISHKHKYVFIEFPQTGSSAVATELISQYDGERILYKHALYSDFLREATFEEKGYFTFSTIRHPMDVVVSKYLKYKNNHENYLKKKVKNGRLRKVISRYLERKRYLYVKDNNADFETYFLKFYKVPYASWSIVDHRCFDYIMRFEKLDEEFDKVLNFLGIEKTRPLRKFNQTKKENKHFSAYYKSERVKQRAIQIFTPYMRAWDYDFNFKENKRLLEKREGQKNAVESAFELVRASSIETKTINETANLYRRISNGPITSDKLLKLETETHSNSFDETALNWSNDLPISQTVEISRSQEEKSLDQRTKEKLIRFKSGNQMLYNLCNLFRIFYWKYLR